MPIRPGEKTGPPPGPAAPGAAAGMSPAHLLAASASGPVTPPNTILQVNASSITVSACSPHRRGICPTDCQPVASTTPRPPAVAAHRS